MLKKIFTNQQNKVGLLEESYYAFLSLSTYERWLYQPGSHSHIIVCVTVIAHMPLPETLTFLQYDWTVDVVHLSFIFREFSRPLMQCCFESHCGY